MGKPTKSRHPSASTWAAGQIGPSILPGPSVGEAASTLHKGVNPCPGASRCCSCCHECATSQGRAARRAGIASAQSLPPARWADAGRARSKAQRGVHGARKLHGAKTKAPTRWSGSIPTPSGRTCPVRAQRVRRVPRRQIFSPASLISASQSTSGWPACTTAARCSIPSSNGSAWVMPAFRWDADGRVEVRKRYAQARRLARRVSRGQAD
jgi:hypothetical protein